jgi:hypothetical protein
MPVVINQFEVETEAPAAPAPAAAAEPPASAADSPAIKEQIERALHQQEWRAARLRAY